MKHKACSLSISVLAVFGTMLAFSGPRQLFAAGGGAGGATGVGAVVPVGTPSVGPATSVGPAQISVGTPLNQPGTPLNQPSGSFATGAAVGAPTTLPGMANQTGMGMQSGNAPIGSPLGNQQLQTQAKPYNGSLQSPGSISPGIGGVNGRGAVVGGLENQNGGLQGFQNGSFGMGGFNNGGMTGPTANQQAMPPVGVTGPNYFPNANTNANTNNNGYVPGNNVNVYGYNATSPNNVGGYNAAPPIRLEQSAAEGQFQCGWW